MQLTDAVDARSRGRLVNSAASASPQPSAVIAVEFVYPHGLDVERPTSNGLDKERTCAIKTILKTIDRSTKLADW